jgi:beta-galactosidase
MRLDKAKVNCHAISASKSDGAVTVKASYTLAAPSKNPVLWIDTEYVFSAGRGIEITTHARVNGSAPALPRFGYRLAMPESSEDITYFGYGPGEAYEDLSLSARLGLFKTTVTENFEHYVRPQENSAHCRTRFMALSKVYGQGLYFSADSFSFSASHYTPEAITEAKHDFELIPDKETTVIIDYRNAGIGSNSCGPALDARYAIGEKEIDFKFNIKPLFVGNASLFGEYIK